MKKTPVLDYEIMGSVGSWSVEVSMSRNQKSGVWTLYFKQTDPEARDLIVHRANDSGDFFVIADERNMEMGSFCSALLATRNEKLIELGKSLQARASVEVDKSGLPRRFWRIRDAAVDHVLTNSPLPEGIEDVQEWLEIDGWESLVAAWINEDIAINLKVLAERHYSDSCLRHAEELDDYAAIADAMRVEYARAVIKRAVERCDDCESPSVHSYRLERMDGQSAVLGCTIEFRGQAGNLIDWHGVFARREAFYDHLRRSGFLLYRAADEIGDAEILALWQVEATKKTGPGKRRR
jgi:hypothetical protein